MPRIANVPKALEMDYSRILNKPFLIQTLSWTSSTGSYSLLPKISLPSAALTNFLARVPFKSSCLYRMRACVMLQVSGTPMHQGLILASVTPSSLVPVHPTQLLQGPHSFLNANESTSVCIEVPFYQRAPLARTNTDLTNDTAVSPFDYADLRMMVLDPLASTGTASSSLTISIHVIIREAEFYVPKVSDATWVAAGSSEQKPVFEAQGFIGDLLKIPTRIFDGLAVGAKTVTGDFIDALRVGTRTLTGFHNPNSTTIDTRMIVTTRNFGNQVDQPTLVEKLDQHGQYDRIVQDYQFNTDQDEMDVSYVLRKPAYLGKFGINTADTSGTLLFAAPITPFIEVDSTQFYSPMRLLYECSRYWRGTLKLHIQSVMTNFQYCKILVVRDYGGDKRVLTLHPEMNDVHNLITDTLEFSAGGQIQTVELPFCSQLEQLECTKSLSTNALSHGMVYVYLLQPLTTNGSVPTSVTFNAYMSADKDFQFYGYAVDNVRHSYVPATFSGEVPEFEAEADVTESNETTVGISGQQEVINEKVETEESYMRVDDFKPMTSVRDYMRRFVFARTLVLNSDAANNGVTAVSINSIIANSGNDSNGAVAAIKRMFFGFYGGYKFKLLIRGAQNCRIYYVPPGSTYNTVNNRLDATTPNTEWIKTKCGFSTVSEKLGTVYQELPVTHRFVNTQPSLDVVEFEFAVPNMNPCRFVGGSASYNSSQTNFDGALGHIIVCIPVQTTPNTAIAEWYTGITDESRFGFQVFTPPYSIPTFTTTGTPPVVYRNSAYNISATVGMITDTTTYPGAYYFNLP
nr:MAG: capsid protein [Crogonang virus 21]